MSHLKSTSIDHTSVVLMKSVGTNAMWPFRQRANSKLTLIWCTFLEMFKVIMMLETYLISSQVKIKIVVQVNSMKVERNINPRNLRNF